MSQIPNARVSVLSDDGSLSLPWRLWAQNLTGSDGSSITPAEFQALVDLVAIIQAEAATALVDADAALIAARAAEMIALVSLSGAGDGSSPASAPAGFGFFAGGTMTAGEPLGTAVWGNARTFAGSPQDVARALYGSTLDSVFTLNAYDTFGTRYVAGTVEFNGTNVGTVSWSSTITIPPGSALEVNAPTPADPSLASVRVMIYGE